MGHSTERHDTHSYETHAGRWLGFRQPVRRVAMGKLGTPVSDTRESNPGEVWEENEFWFELSWRIDPDGSLGIRRYFESPYRPGEKVTVDEYYRWIFENRVPGLPEKAAAQGLSPMDYMRKYGVVEISRDVYRSDERPLDRRRARGRCSRTGTACCASPPTTSRRRRWSARPAAVGVQLDDGSRVAGWLTPSRRLELWSDSVASFGWPEHATPTYIESHVSRRNVDLAAGQLVLVPTFRLPTLIHTRSGNAKYLNEISNTHPLWVHEDDAEQLGFATGDLVRVTTRIGHFVARAWAHQGIRPGVVALSHHMGRWRLDDIHASRWASGKVDLERSEEGMWRMRYAEHPKPFESDDPDSSRIYWDDPGVHQNLTFPVQPDPWSGAHCWHQLVTVAPAEPDDQYGDIEVDTRLAREVVPRVAGDDPTWSERGGAAPAGVHDAAGQAEAEGVPRVSASRIRSAVAGVSSRSAIARSASWAWSTTSPFVAARSGVAVTGLDDDAGVPGSARAGPPGGGRRARWRSGSPWPDPIDGRRWRRRCGARIGAPAPWAAPPG